MTKFWSNFGQFLVKFWPGKTMKTQGGVPRILEFVESWVLGIAPGLSVGVLAHFVKNSPKCTKSLKSPANFIQNFEFGQIWSGEIFKKI